MRMTSHERNVIIQVLSQYVSGDAELRLFGSRVDDDAKGGDIDLLLIVADNQLRDTFAYNKPEILSQVKAEIGEQKIDLVITTLEKIQESAFLQMIYPQSLSLKHWHNL